MCASSIFIPRLISPTHLIPSLPFYLAISSHFFYLPISHTISSFFFFSDVIFVCACGPPGGGRNHITARFLRHFNIINYVELSNGSLCLIFTTILSNFLSTFDQSVAKLAEGIVNATVSVYNTILEDLRPTPAKPHYTFNMRDISKVYLSCVLFLYCVYIS